MVCPANNEGMMYSVLTTMNNLCYTLAADISTLLTYIFAVSNDDIEDGNYNGLIYLTLFICICQVLPFGLLFFSPASRAEQQALIDSGINSEIGGGIMIGFIIFTLLFSLILNFALIS
jgi:hypothetical protein